MPSVDVKTAIVTLLNASFGSSGDSRLKRITTQYPRGSEQTQPGDTPACRVWCDGYDPETIEGGGRATVVVPGPTPPIGIRYHTLQVTLHLRHLVDTPLTSGDAFEQLLDDIESMLRQYPTLNDLSGTQAAGTGYGARDWSVERTFGISREYLPPIPLDSQQIALHAFIRLNVVERINA